MNKRILFALIIIMVLVTITGCSNSPSNTKNSVSQPSVKISRSANISPNWLMKDIEVNLAAGKELPILLKLANGDKVDGEFYLEEGKDVNFNIADSAIFYKPLGVTGIIKSDRFSFIASSGQGIAYTMTFRNPAGVSELNSNITVYIHLIYPDTASLFIPIETKQE